MKKLTYVLLTLCLVLVTTGLAQVLTLDPNQFVNTQILGDTLADGSRAHTIYKLERSTAYAFDGRLDVTFPCTIIGPDNGPIIHDASNGTPPVFVNTPAADGGARNFFVIQEGGSLVLKNLIISGLHNNNEVVEFVVQNTAGNEYTADNVVFADYQGMGFLNRGLDIDISVTNCVFINGARVGYNPWGGFPMLLLVSGKNVLIENNTSVNSGRLYAADCPFFNATIHQLHNTYLNFAKAAQEQRGNEIITANNIFYNFDFLGRSEHSITYESYFTSWNYYTPCADSLDKISLYLGQNAFYREQAILDWFAADTLLPGLFWEHADVDSFVWFDEDYTIGTNYNEFDPEFTVHPGNTPKIVEYLDAYWSSEAERPVECPNWRLPSPVTYDGDGMPVVSWPPAFDLSYANETLLTGGTDGLPVGDLNWFPEAKETYLANRDQYIAALKDSILNAKAVYVPGSPTPMITPDDVTAVDDYNVSNPVVFSLDQNYPNPFNPTTTIAYSVGKSGLVKVEMFNTLGQKVKTLVNENQLSGQYTLTVDGSELTSGVYFYSITAGNFSQTKKMILMK